MRSQIRLDCLVLVCRVKHSPFSDSTIYAYCFTHLSLICCRFLFLSIGLHTSLQASMSIYSPVVVLHILHPLYGQTITLLRPGSSVGDVLDCLNLQPSMRIQHHLSFDGVWLGESVTIAEVCTASTIPVRSHANYGCIRLASQAGTKSCYISTLLLLSSVPFVLANVSFVITLYKQTPNSLSFVLDGQKPGVKL